MKRFTPTEKTRVRRRPTRGHYDAQTIYSILDAGFKVRTGGPIDDEEDYRFPIWAGVVPIQASHGAPLPDARLLGRIAAPGHVRNLAHLGIRPA